MKYYFTYGTDGQPFVGGWTEVEAPTVNLACAAFRAVHPDKEPGILNCSSAYTEESFLGSCMAGPDGNFRKFCHERMSRLISEVLKHERHCRDNRSGNPHRRIQ